MGLHHIKRVKIQMIATEFTESTEVLSAKNANTFIKATILVGWVRRKP